MLRIKESKWEKKKGKYCKGQVTVIFLSAKTNVGEEMNKRNQALKNC